MSRTNESVRHFTQELEFRRRMPRSLGFVTGCIKKGQHSLMRRPMMMGLDEVG